MSYVTSILDEHCDVTFCCALVLLFVIVVFFFKQKTAYEMRISDWSSDVCSSDLAVAPVGTVYAPQTGRRRLSGGEDAAAHGRAAVGSLRPLGQISRKYVRGAR